MPVPEISVENEGEIIEVRAVNPESVSRAMVAEFMILVGEITADFAQKNQIPIPFRGQERKPNFVFPIDETDEIIIKPNNYNLNNLNLNNNFNNTDDVESKFIEWIKNILAQWDKKKQLASAKISVEPKPHNGLKLSSYCQATSPIRRYLDLLVHFQIKAVLRGEKPPFPKETISQLISDIETPQIEINKLHNQSQRYWILRYFEQKSKNRSTFFSALVLTIQKHAFGMLHGVQVLMLDLGYEMGIALKRVPMRGEILRLMLSGINVFDNQIHFEENYD